MSPFHFKFSSPSCTDFGPLHYIYCHWYTAGKCWLCQEVLQTHQSCLFKLLGDQESGWNTQYCRCITVCTHDPWRDSMVSIFYKPFCAHDMCYHHCLGFRTQFWNRFFGIFFSFFEFQFFLQCDYFLFFFCQKGHLLFLTSFQITTIPQLTKLIGFCHKQADSHARDLSGTSIWLSYCCPFVTGVSLSRKKLQQMWRKHTTENRNCLTYCSLQSHSSDLFSWEKNKQHEWPNHPSTHKITSQGDGSVLFWSIWLVHFFQVTCLDVSRNADCFSYSYWAASGPAWMFQVRCVE